jgi:hypothetical protein
MPKYRITETIEYAIEADDPNTAMREFLYDPSRYMTGITDRGMDELVVRFGHYRAVEAHEFEQAEMSS